MFCFWERKKGRNQKEKEKREKIVLFGTLFGKLSLTLFLPLTLFHSLSLSLSVYISPTRTSLIFLTFIFLFSLFTHILAYMVLLLVPLSPCGFLSSQLLFILLSSFPISLSIFSFLSSVFSLSLSLSLCDTLLRTHSSSAFFLSNLILTTQHTRPNTLCCSSLSLFVRVFVCSRFLPSSIPFFNVYYVLR